MKLKAVIDNEGAGGPNQLANQAMILHVLQALQRLERASERKGEKTRGAPTVVLKLAPESFAFCHRGGADEGSQTWSHFQPSHLFHEYRIESKRANKIDLEAPIANLLHVFHSCAASDKTSLRLANGKDGRPILGFEFSLAGNVADHLVSQEVPVRVIPEAEAQDIAEPALPEPDYQIEWPNNLQRLKGVLDKMRQVGAQIVSVEASQERPVAAEGTTVADAPTSTGARASLKFSAETDLVSIATTFPSLVLVMEGKTTVPERPVRLLLSLRRLGEVLAAMQHVGAVSNIACVLEDKALVMYGLLPKQLGSLISYSPAMVT
jgi:hypothetical protein